MARAIFSGPPAKPHEHAGIAPGDPDQALRADFPRPTLGGVLRAASNHADLVYHALAFVPPRLDAAPVVHAVSLHRPTWMRFAQARFPPGAVVPIARAAPLVGGLVTCAGPALALQCLATLHDTIAACAATARRPLAELRCTEVARPADLLALQGAPAAVLELFRAAIGLAMREFALVHATLLRPFAERVAGGLGPRLAQLVTEVPGLASLTVQLSATLGPSFRPCGNTVFVGTRTLPDDESPADTDTPLALVAHAGAARAACLVMSARGIATTWELATRVALDTGERAYRGTCAESAHGQWRAGLRPHGLPRRDAGVNELVAEATALLAG